MKVIKIDTEVADLEVMEVSGELHELQELVGGYIEPGAPVELREKGIELLVDEEGLLKGLEPNPNIYPFFFVGPCVLVGVSGEDFVSLTDEQIIFALRWLKDLARFI